MSAGLKDILKKMMKDLASTASKGKDFYLRSAKSIPGNVEGVARGVIKARDLKKALAQKPGWMPGKDTLKKLISSSHGEAAQSAKELAKNLGITVGVPGGAAALMAASLKGSEKKATLIERLEKAADIFVNKDTSSGGYLPSAGTMMGAGVLGTAAVAHPMTNRMIGSMGKPEWAQAVRETGADIRRPFEVALGKQDRRGGQKVEKLQKKLQEAQQKGQASTSELLGMKNQQVAREAETLAKASGMPVPLEYDKHGKAFINRNVKRKAGKLAVERKGGVLGKIKEYFKGETEATTKAQAARKATKQHAGEAWTAAKEYGKKRLSLLGKATKDIGEAAAYPFVAAGRGLKAGGKVIGQTAGAMGGAYKKLKGDLAGIRGAGQATSGAGRAAGAAARAAGQAAGSTVQAGSQAGMQALRKRIAQGTKPGMVQRILGGLRGVASKFKGKIGLGSYGYEPQIVFSKGFEDYLEKKAESLDEMAAGYGRVGGILSKKYKKMEDWAKPKEKERSADGRHDWSDTLKINYATGKDLSRDTLYKRKQKIKKMKESDQKKIVSENLMADRRTRLKHQKKYYATRVGEKHGPQAKKDVLKIQKMRMDRRIRAKKATDREIRLAKLRKVRDAKLKDFKDENWRRLDQAGHAIRETAGGAMSAAVDAKKYLLGSDERKAKAGPMMKMTKSQRAAAIAKRKAAKKQPVAISKPVIATKPKPKIAPTKWAPIAPSKAPAKKIETAVARSKPARTPARSAPAVAKPTAKPGADWGKHIDSDYAKQGIGKAVAPLKGNIGYAGGLKSSKSAPVVKKASKRNTLSNRYK